MAYMAAEGHPVRCPLTATQVQALRYVDEGVPSDEAASRMGITCNALKLRIRRARQRLGVRTTSEAVAAVRAAGWRAQDARSVPITSAQRLYLDAFDDLLRARTDTDKAAARSAMDRALHGVAGSAATRPNRTRGDLVEMIARAIER